MIAAFQFSLAYAGFTALALAMHRHHRQIWQRGPTALRRIGFRAAGIVCLALALAACVVEDGWFTGVVQWFAMLTASAIAFDFLLSYAPRAAAAASFLALPIAAAALVGWL